MTGTDRIGIDSTTVLAYQKQYHTQKRLADALFGLFRTLGSALHVERVANIGLLTLTGQLLIKCAAFFQRDDAGTYRLLATVGSRDSRLDDLEFPETISQIAVLFRERTVVSFEKESSTDHSAITKLREHGFVHMFPLADGSEPLGIIVLGRKIIPGDLTAEDLQLLDAFGVVISVSLKNSVAYQVMESSRNELKRLNEMKNEFLSHVSHEFRTPLTILKSTIEMIDVDPEIYEMQNSAVVRFEHLINTVLLLNEINSNGVQLDLRSYQLHDWVNDELRPILEKQSHKFDLYVDLPQSSIEFDCFKINMTVEGLVDNAAKFGGQGSDPGEDDQENLKTQKHCEVYVYLTTRERVLEEVQATANDFDHLQSGLAKTSAPVDTQSSEALLVIEIKDFGIGIPPQELEAVFQPFTQAVNSPTRGVRGAGLGLSMAKRIIDAHDGEIFCRSAIDCGTIFYLAIPMKPPNRIHTKR